MPLGRCGGGGGDVRGEGGGGLIPRPPARRYPLRYRKCSRK